MNSQRLLNPLPLLICDPYHLQVVWLARLLSCPPLDNTLNVSLGFLEFSNEVMLYNIMSGVRMVCRILWKNYISLIITHDECRSFLHISHVRQKLPNPNTSLIQCLIAMYSALVANNVMVGCFLHFYEIILKPTKNTYPMEDHQLFTSSA